MLNAAQEQKQRVKKNYNIQNKNKMIAEHLTQNVQIQEKEGRKKEKKFSFFHALEKKKKFLKENLRMKALKRGETTSLKISQTRDEEKRKKN